MSSAKKNRKPAKTKDEIERLSKLKLAASSAAKSPPKAKKSTVKKIPHALDIFTTTLLSGLLQMKSQRSGPATKRWVKLCSDPQSENFMIFYFQSKHERRKKLKGSLSITDLCQLKRGHSTGMVLTLESGAQVHFIAKDCEERMKWITCLRECISKSDKTWAEHYIEHHSLKTAGLAMGVVKNFLLKHSEHKEFLAQEIAARFIQRLWRKYHMSHLARLNDELLRRIENLNRIVMEIDKQVDENTVLKGKSWTSERERNYKKLRKLHAALQERTANSMNLVFVQKIAEGDASEALEDNATFRLSKQNPEKLCKKCLEEAGDQEDRAFVLEKILLRENTILVEIENAEKFSPSRTRRQSRRRSSLRASFEPTDDLEPNKNGGSGDDAEYGTPDNPYVLIKRSAESFQPSAPSGNPDAEGHDEAVPPPPGTDIQTGPATAAESV